MLIAYVLKNGKKVTVAEKCGCDKDLFKTELNEKGIKYDGVDKIYNL